MSAATAETVPLFSSFALRNYRLFWVGGFVSNIGTWMARIAQDWLVLTVLTHNSAFALGLITGLQFLPTAVLAPYAGTLADRFDKRRVLILTQVNYRTGRLHDMAALSAAAHAAGALAVWDLAHSAGAVPVALAADGADFAVGCGYKYLNGGPGAPAFCWARPDHAAAAWQPLAGWHGHAAPFAFEPGYQPAPGMARYLCGTPPVLAMAALECGVDTLLAAEALGGMAAIRAKSLALTRLFITLVQQRCGGHGLVFASPDADAERGSQVCLAFAPDSAAGRAGGAFAVVQALIARRVVGDFRAGAPANDRRDGQRDGLPDILRFGVTPLYTRFADVWDGVEQLRQVLASGEWREPRFNQRGVVT